MSCSRSLTDYEEVDWEAGERPAWWSSRELIWEFSPLDGDWRFATADLDVATETLQTRHAYMDDAEFGDRLRRALFTTIPLAPGQRVRIELDPLTQPPVPTPVDRAAYEVTTHPLTAFLRERVRRMDHTDRTLREVKRTTEAEVARIAAKVLADTPQDAHLLFDPTDSYFHLGVDAHRLKAWANAHSYFLLARFCDGFIADRREQRQAETEDRSASALMRKEEAQRQRALHKRVQELTVFFSHPQYVPRSPEEQEARRLHDLVMQAESVEERTAAEGRRNEYIAHHIMGYE